MKVVWEKPSDFINFLREQRSLELDHVRALRPTLKVVSDKLAKALLESVILDSRKHAILCKAIIDVETGAAPIEMDVGDIVDMDQAIETHIRMEAEMIKRLESMLERTEDDRTKAIMLHMISDERRHHNILQRLADLIIKNK